MRKKSSRARINLVSTIVILWFAAVIPAAAQSKDDLYTRGTAAESKGDAIAARDAFCAIKDAEYKDAASKCTTYIAEATRALNRYNQNYYEGVQLMQEGKLDQAETKFRNVKAGERFQAAQAELAKIPKLKQDKAAADAQAKASSDSDASSQKNLSQGIDAFNRGDLNAAKGLLESVSGKSQGDAQSYLNRINNYNLKMSEARGYETAKNYAAAKAAYTDAARISSSGPGDPLTAVSRVTELAAGNSAAVITKPAAVATKDVVKTIDVSKWMADGNQAVAKGDFKKARRYFSDVLGQEPKNAAARAAIQALPKEEVISTEIVGEGDAQLEGLIRAFYAGGSLSDAEDGFKFYVMSGGKKPGLANFYAGVCIATRYFLDGAKDARLRDEARNKFRSAKAAAGFHPPEKMISPKILKIFNETT